MVLLSLTYSLLMYFCGIYVYSSSHKLLLLGLLSLEYIVVSMYMIMSIYLIMYGLEFFFLVIFLVFSACEGALGLSILVSMIPSYGNDFFYSFSFSLCQYMYYFCCLWYLYVY